MKIKSVKEAHIKKGERVIMRADFDIPVARGKIADDFRIQAHLPALQYILQRTENLCLISHRGRPGGVKDKNLSLWPVVGHLEKLLKKKIMFIRDPLSESARRSCDNAKGLFCLENLRFWKEEESGSKLFAKTLSQWGDLYVNEAFANSHRAHTSMTALPRILPSYAGLHLEKEIRYLGRLLKNPKRPLVAVLGGIKLETKLPLIRRFLASADSVLISGGIANSFFRAKRFETGKSFVEPIRERALLQNPRIFLPEDVVVVQRIACGKSRVKLPEEVTKEEYIMDIGPRSIGRFISLLKRARTVIWNGPLGCTPRFSKSTDRFMNALAKTRAFTVVGGGDTVAALKRGGVSPGRFSHVSTGGGAMLEFLAGKKLPGIEALKREYRK